MAIKFLSTPNLSDVTAGSILKVDSNGNIVAAVDGTDYNTGSADSWSDVGYNIYRNSDVRIGTFSSGVAPDARLHVFDYQTTDPKLLIEDGNTGDASMQFKISTQRYTMGIDNSDSDKFVLAASSAFGTTNALEISTSGTTTFKSTAYFEGDAYFDADGQTFYFTADDTDRTTVRWQIDGGNKYVLSTVGANSLYWGRESGNTSGHIELDTPIRVTGSLTVNTDSYTNTINTGHSGALNLIDTKTLLLDDSFGTNDGRVFGVLQPAPFKPSDITLGDSAYSSAATGSYVTNNYPNVKGESDATGIMNGATFTFAEALDQAETLGGRLPTLEEIMSGVGRGSGQGYDNEYIWTQTKAGHGRYWVAKGSAVTTNDAIVVDTNADTAPEYRMRIFYDISKDNMPVYYDNSSNIRTKSIKAESSSGITFKSDSDNTQVIINGSGNVGIGTASPNDIFHIYGNGASTYVTNQRSATKWSEWHVGSTDHALFWDSTADMRFMTETGLGGSGPSEKMRITSGGNVGIGTNDPSSKLEVSGSSLTELKVTESSSSVTTMVQSSTTYGWVGTKTNHTMYIGADDSAKITVLTGGNVGIGITNPQKKLDVRGGYFITNDGSGKETAFVQGGTGYAYFGNLNAAPAAFGNSENWTTLVADGGNVGIGETSPTSKLEVRGTTATHQLVSINRANSSTAALYLGNNSSNDAIISGNNAPISLGKDVSGTYTEYVNIATDGELKFGAYGAGILKTNAAGIVSLDTNTYLTSVSVDWSDIISINGTININSTTQIGQGDTETLVSFQNSGTERGRFEVDDSANSYFVATGFKTATASTGFLKADGTVDTNTYSTATGVANNADVTPSWVPATDPAYATTDYVDQELTGLASESWANTNLVNVTGDTMTGDLTIKRGHGDLTFLTLKQENTGADLVEQKSFIDFTFVDSNTNETPQVRIGAEVGNNDGSASTQGEEGMGAFVVYTNNADTDAGAAGTSLAERFRVDRLGRVGIGTSNPTQKLHVAGDIYTTSDFLGNSIISASAALSIDNTGIQPDQGDVEDIVSFKFSGTKVSHIDTDGYVFAAGFKTNTAATGFLKADGSVDTNTYSTATGVSNNADVTPSWVPATDPGYASTDYVDTELTGLASESYVTTAISNLVDSAPATLDTLNELAAALGDDANFSTTVTNSIATKLSLSGGTMSGDLNLGSNDIKAVSSIVLNNREGSDFGTVNGTLIFDENFYGDTEYGTAWAGGNGGGLAIYGEDGWNRILSDKNAQWFLGSAAFSSTGDFVAVSGDTITGQVIFPSAATTKPVLPNGFISRNDNDDTTGRHDIWGISERYYPSNSTASDAWGIQWSGTPNDVVFVGGGEDKVTISLDEGNITTTGSLSVGNGVTLSESTDRADLLYINSSTSGWGGLQIGNTSNEFIFSLMGNGNAGGIYDDQNGEWIIYWDENAGAYLYHNGNQKLLTVSDGVNITGRLYASSGIQVPYGAGEHRPMVVLSGATNYGLFHTEATSDEFTFDFNGTQMYKFRQDGVFTINGNTITTGKVTNWDNAYTYSQVGHLPLAGGTLTGNLTMSSATPTLKFSINGAENNAGIVWEDGDAGDPSAQAAAIKWSASDNIMRFYNNDESAERMRIATDGTVTFANGIVASGGIAGLTLANGGISGTNFNITGVNQLEIADPGEGIVFKSGSSGDMTLAIVDDSSDNILRFSGTNATFDVAGSLTATNLTIADAVYHEGDTNTSISFGTDTINFNTGGGVRATINDSGAKFNNNVIVSGGSTLSLGEAGEEDDNGRTVLIEGVANGGNGEGVFALYFSMLRVCLDRCFMLSSSPLSRDLDQ